MANCRMECLIECAVPVVRVAGHVIPPRPLGGQRPDPLCLLSDTQRARVDRIDDAHHMVLEASRQRLHHFRRGTRKLQQLAAVVQDELADAGKPRAVGSARRRGEVMVWSKCAGVVDTTDVEDE